VCQVDNDDDYSITNDVLTYDSKCTSVETDQINWNCNLPTGVTSVVLPQELTIIGDSVFSDCSSLTSVSFPEGLQQVGENAFFGCSSLTSVTFPEGLQQVGDHAFRECSSLTSVTLPQGVHQLGRYAFDTDITFTPSSNPCTEGNYHSDACKDKITSKYNKTQFIDLYTYGNYATCN